MFFGAAGFFGTINQVLITIIIVFLIWWGVPALYYKIRSSRAATWVDDEAFKEGMRKAQVIDLRDKADFKSGHILGARNIPYLELKQYMTGLRHDQPIYLYDLRKTYSQRAAILLKKNGFTDIYCLKGGYDKWTGKVKKNKY